MCFAYSLFVVTSLLVILTYVEANSTNCTKHQLGKVKEKYQTCVQQKLPQMKQSHLAHFTDQKRCQIINNVSFWRASFLTFLEIGYFIYLRTSHDKSSIVSLLCYCFWAMRAVPLRAGT